MGQPREEGIMSDYSSPDLLKSDQRAVRQVLPRRPGLKLVAAVASLCLVLAACGSDSDESATSSTAEPSTTVANEQQSDRTVVTADDDTGAAQDATTTTEGAASTSAAVDEEPPVEGVAGEPLDFGPSLGTGLAIVGVAFDDTLNFRAEPAPDAEILEAFGPLSADLDISALGEAWAAPSGVWWKVNVAGTEAWANQAFLGGLGSTQSAFDQVAAEFGVLKFETVEAAALAVAELRASDDPESRIVFVGEPLAFEVGGFAVVDVLDLPDDAVKGERIRVDVDIVFDEASGEEGAQDVAFVVLTNVEITPICGRGVSGGLCT